MIIVTGATGKLGQLVIQELLMRVPPKQIVAAVRNPEKAAGLSALGVTIRQADYDKPETLEMAFAGGKQMLLISANEIGKRAMQHANAIAAAKKTGVQFLAYTSILRADTSKLGLAKEHLETEEAIKHSGIKYTLLRNGWYLENHSENLGPALEHGAIIGAAGNGKFASAARKDYAAAAAIILTQAGHDNKTYELVGDHSFTLTELAATLSKLANKPIVYNNLSKEAYQEALLGFGVPAPMAELLADSDQCASEGELDSQSRDLPKLLGRTTTTLYEAVSRALRVR